MLNKDIFKLIEQLEGTVIANRSRKSLLPPIKGKSYAEGRVGSLELKRCMEKLSKDDESAFLVQGLVYGCLMLGEDAGRYLTTSQANEYFKPYIETRNKQKESGKMQEHRLKQSCLLIAKSTWLKYPTASTASLARKIHVHFGGNEETLKLQTIEKNWLPKSGFRANEWPNTSLKYELVHADDNS